MMDGVDLGIPGYENAVEVGRGGFAIVYRAWQPDFHRHVAIKVLPADLDEDALRRFAGECAAIGALSGHPNIVTVYDHGESPGGQRYISMEYLHGRSLAERIEETGGPMPWPTVAEIGVRLAGALASAHRSGVLHRDIKPENVLMSRLDEPKLGDFGIARMRGRPHTRTGVVSATVSHAAPEILGGGRSTVASDVYSLGSTLFTLLAGRSPFERSDDEGPAPLLYRIAYEPAPDLREKGVPGLMCEAIEQALAKEPTERQKSAVGLGRQLQSVQAQLGLPTAHLLLEAPPHRDRAGPPDMTSGEQEPEPKQEPEPGQEPEQKPEPERHYPTGYVLLAMFVLALLVVAIVIIGDTPSETAQEEPAQPSMPVARPIAFQRGGQTDGGIYVINADGRGERRLTSSQDSFPVWSPDGRRILFKRDADGTDQLYVMDRDGSDVTRISDTSVRESFPSWSPDGRRIAFRSSSAGNEEIWLVDTDGRNPFRLTQSAARDTSPAWSPDGSQIAFTSERDGNAEIYVMKVDGSGERRLTSNTVEDDTPHWSPDGRRIAFTSERSGNNDIFIMASDGSGLRQLTADRASDFGAVWSTDGRQLAFESNREGRSQIFVMDADGSNVMRVTNGRAPASFPAWGVA